VTWNQYNRKNKYSNKKTEVDGYKFDSHKEAKYYLYLKSRQENKEIKNLRLQPVFTLQENFTHEGKTIRKIKYVADFSYHEDDVFTVIDVKGMKTDVYKLKKKLFLFKYPSIKFIEV